jgi:hypothetical protein
VFPTATKRKRPKDLYLGGTSRTTTSTIRTDSGFDYYTFTYPRSWRTNASVSSFFYVGDKVVPVESIDRELVYNKIRAEIRGDATNLAQMMAEYAQTAQLFRDLAEVVVTKGKSLIRRHGASIARAKKVDVYSKSASDAYLAWTYGISPLCSDMASAMNELRNRSGIPLYREGVESRRTRGQSSGTESANSTVNTCSAEWSGVREIRYRCQWRAYINTDALTNILVSHGFGNPLAVGYELIPFSFVIDWWVNIGEVLASLDNLVLIKSLYVLESTSDKQFIMTQTKAHREIIKPGAATLLKRVDTRSAPTTIPRVASFKYDPSISKKHIMNGLALLNSLRR